MSMILHDNIFLPQYRNKYSPLYCPKCRRQLTRREGREFQNNGIYSIVCCTGRVSPRAKVLKSSQHLLDASKITAVNFYHTTTRETWHQDIYKSTSLHVHIGTVQAADSNGRNKKTPYRYKVRIKDDASVFPHILGDWECNEIDQGILSGEDILPQYLTYKSSPYDVYRYENIFESPGSISLLVNTRAMTILDRKNTTYGW